MHRGLYFFTFSVSVIFNFVGLIANLFIMVVLCRTWVKSHRISSSDRILFSLAITRFLILGLFLLNIVYHATNAERSVYFSIFFLLCWRFLDSNSLWLVTLLNSMYCVKITNFQHPLFLLLRRTISAKTTGLLLSCLLISAFTALLHFTLRQMSHFSEHLTGRNDTSFDLSEGILTLAVSFFLSSLLQFMLNVTFASLLIHSLKRHIQKMQRNRTSFWNPQTEAHMGAMRLMICFLMLYIPYSIASLLYLPSYEKKNLKAQAVCLIMSAAYPPGHSALLIITHHKLKAKAKKIFCFYK
ncbi:taste receptor type 2 member 4 [Psammomys obesus]|uniref:taste receptor type 2 member 4 n=1 Tax=Psammomys obesus TaxID=48139 RepID=UPI002452FC9C|nr:taste receptor type 2 member 4 [Psammomys obesus]